MAETVNTLACLAWLGLAWLGKHVRSQVQALLDVSNVELCKFQISKNKQEQLLAGMDGHGRRIWLGDHFRFLYCCAFQDCFRTKLNVWG